FTLSITVDIVPEDNSQLSGLYKSSGLYCTQCEAMGFRRITYFMDRPDVMTKYTVAVTADKKSCPVLLSNGNRLSLTDNPDGTHTATWEDPHPKPSYLFALVAGNLYSHEGTFAAMEGRDVKCEILVEPVNKDKCEHALQSLMKAMRWDEVTFGRCYDLSNYMLVAVNDFNMGAMENKGLNIFNSKYVLARPDTATDADYEAIEGVIGHEYFHNWTGNRVTLRDWFQLTLKEGLTVFRDQQFSADHTSHAVKRIDDVKIVRAHQYPEDAGPMCHPVRPESYIAMDNFYTATVYDKGAEVVRMYHTLLGPEGFRKGMDLYFTRHDGHAVTCDDFRAAMADANDRDLTQFERWYFQSGTPTLTVQETHDMGTQQYTLTLTQSGPVTDGQAAFLPYHMPVRVGLLDGISGVPLSVTHMGVKASDHLLELTDLTQKFVFSGVPTRPVLSVLRNYSAPVKVVCERADADLLFLMGRDTDPFNRWDAGQTYMRQLVSAMVHDKDMEVPGEFTDALRSTLFDPLLDGSLKALALTLPSEKELSGDLPLPVPVEALHAARTRIIHTIALRLEKELTEVYHRLSGKAYEFSQTDVNNRRVKNVCLFYLSHCGEKGLTLAYSQFKGADNMTDSISALVTLASHRCSQREQALEAFYTQWEQDPLVIDKWFSAQALSQAPDVYERCRSLESHPAFSLDNPNRARSLISAFCAGNHANFHRSDGAGYVWLADTVLALHVKNPQLAARMVQAFNPYKRYDCVRQDMMRAQLERLRDTGKGEGEGETLSKDVLEIVNRALA
ncbi:peptidase M1, alanyl aminopeptidase, partial [Kipferlia bialata]